MPKYSQVFLENGEAAEKIVSFLGAAGGKVVEIGPGRGILTEILAEKYCGNLLLVEIDSALAERLAVRFRGRAEVLNADFLKLDLDPLGGEKNSFIGNLPYDCSTAILEKVLLSEKWAKCVFMFQKEVAVRICAGVSEPDYSYFSLLSHFLSERKTVMEVPASYFNPVPKVDSAVVVFDRKETPLSRDVFPVFMSFLKKCFLYRRKTVLNGLSLAFRKEKAAIKTALDKAGINPSLRPQEISPEEYLKLFSALK